MNNDIVILFNRVLDVMDVLDVQHFQNIHYVQHTAYRQNLLLPKLHHLSFNHLRDCILTPGWMASCFGRKFVVSECAVKLDDII